MTDNEPTTDMESESIHALTGTFFSRITMPASSCCIIDVADVVNRAFDTPRNHSNSLNSLENLDKSKSTIRKDLNDIFLHFRNKGSTSSVILNAFLNNGPYSDSTDANIAWYLLDLIVNCMWLAQRYPHKSDHVLGLVLLDEIWNHRQSIGEPGILLNYLRQLLLAYPLTINSKLSSEVPVSVRNILIAMMIIPADRNDLLNHYQEKRFEFDASYWILRFSQEIAERKLHLELEETLYFTVNDYLPRIIWFCLFLSEHQKTPADPDYIKEALSFGRLEQISISGFRSYNDRIIGSIKDAVISILDRYNSKNGIPIHSKSGYALDELLDDFELSRQVGAIAWVCGNYETHHTEMTERQRNSNTSLIKYFQKLEYEDVPEGQVDGRRFIFMDRVIKHASLDEIPSLRAWFHDTIEPMLRNSSYEVSSLPSLRLVKMVANLAWLDRAEYGVYHQAIDSKIPNLNAFTADHTKASLVLQIRSSMLRFSELSKEFGEEAKASVKYLTNFDLRGPIVFHVVDFMIQLLDSNGLQITELVEEMTEIALNILVNNVNDCGEEKRSVEHDTSLPNGSDEYVASDRTNVYLSVSRFFKFAETYVSGQCRESVTRSIQMVLQQHFDMDLSALIGLKTILTKFNEPLG